MSRFEVIKIQKKKAVFATMDAVHRSTAQAEGQILIKFGIRTYFGIVHPPPFFR